MTILPQPHRVVELEANEFADIYARLRATLLDFLGESHGSSLEGPELVVACRAKLARVRRSNSTFDLAKGFLPLYERLYTARENPAKRGLNGSARTVYHVSF